jgi:hypothetical protein
VDASVAERLRRWIQVPVNFVGVGSIPTGCTFFSLLGKKMRQPGVEPGAKAWEASMLPIHHWRKLKAVCVRRKTKRTMGLVGTESPQS